MKNVLFISFYFPPLGGAGTQRNFAYAKYLLNYNWHSVVLTVKNKVHHFYDYDQLKELNKKNIEVYRTLYFEPRHIYKREVDYQKNDKKQQNNNKISLVNIFKKIVSFIFIVDDLIFWLPFAYYKGLKIIKKQKIDIIYSTSPPETSHLIAFLLSKKMKIPWVADFRDEWSSDPYRYFPTLLHKKINYFLEKKVINKASKIIGATDYITDDLKKRCTDKTKFTTITNGYDYNLESISRRQKRNDRFTIMHTGSFSKSDGPDIFLKALETAIKQKAIPENKIQLVLIGSLLRFNTEIDCKIIKYISYQSYQRTINFLPEADLLLLIVSKKRGGGAYTTKIFDYIASGVPILALIPRDGLAAKLINKTNTGYVIDSEQSEETKKMIIKLYQQWEDGKLKSAPNYDIIKQYSRIVLAEKLATIFNELS